MILHINTSKTWRGGENQLFLLALGLQKENITQTVVCCKDSPLSEKCHKSKIPILEVKFDNYLSFFSNLSIIRNFAKEKNVKIIHTHTAKAHSFGFLVKKKFPQLKLIVARRVDFHIQKNYLSQQKYKSPLNDYFLCVSQNIRNVLIEDNIDPQKLVTVYSGIKLRPNAVINKNHNLSKEFSLAKNCVKIGNIAALVDHKDQKTLLNAISKIQINKPFKFFILGEGKLEKNLKSQAHKLGISDKVIFTGFRNDVEDFLEFIDIFTLTSKEEGLGTILLDAMKNGLPIVATRGGGIPEALTENQGAYLAKVGDSETLAKYYTQLIKNNNLRKSFGKVNQELVKKFSIENTIKKTIQVYYSLLGDKIYT